MCPLGNNKRRTRKETEKRSSLDDQLEYILDFAMKGDINIRKQTMTSIVYKLGKETFGDRGDKLPPTFSGLERYNDS